MQALIIAIGSELTTGEILDTNSQWLSRELNARGIWVRRTMTITDDLDLIVESLCASTETVVITSGGLGPTIDDRTRDAVAKFLGVELEYHESVWDDIQAKFKAFGREAPENNKKQAYIPAGATLLENRFGTASCFAAKMGDRLLFSLPGVPRELKGMFAEACLPMIDDFLMDSGAPAGKIATRLIRIFGMSEAAVDQALADFFEESDARSVGLMASDGVINVRIATRGGPRELDAISEGVRSRIGGSVFGEGGDTLESVVIAECVKRGFKVATVESCTGGLVASRLTDVPGSSDAMMEGLVVYSNEAKTRLAGVDPSIIEKHGAVSAETAEALASSYQKLSGADLVIATTGIAGPGGGSFEKPVGLCYVAACLRGQTEVRKVQFPHDRISNKDRFAKCALDLARRLLHLDSPVFPGISC
ncbi:MAG: CinA family nicotinamide mononucleotide deamidase-related protein [Planctomycetes bacterium]|nr:CinA family nicotinamide mononucleotide deamidase-related protein [Planctomycetota bacterium]